MRDDIEDVRGFYEKHRHRKFPPSKLVGIEWAFFRWHQVALLAGLDYFASYGVSGKPNKKLIHNEVLDLDYLTPALMAGGLACRENRFVERFKFLRPDAMVLKGPS